MRDIIFILISSIFLVFCTDNTKNIGETNIMDQQVVNDLKIIEKARIFFGHQSVGYNIIEGMRELSDEAESKLNIIEINRKTLLPSYYFAHAQIGQNTKPITKCDAFFKFLKWNFTDSLQVALLKFCYVDINSSSDIQSIFEYYKNTISEITKQHPHITLIHVTVPLCSIQSGWKASIKKILGKQLGGIGDNIKRNQFNNLLRNNYKHEPIFDLAKVESTYPDGSRETFKIDEKNYYALAPDYTTDGGHLNSLGRKLAAKELIHVLATVLKNKE